MNWMPCLDLRPIFRARLDPHIRIDHPSAVLSPFT
jgi:hypothetical protein